MLASNKKNNSMTVKFSSKIYIEKAGLSDTEFLWYLRNQPYVYRYSRQNKPVSWPDHINWVMPLILGFNEKKLFVVKKNRLPIGQVRFDLVSQTEAEISISILKEFHGQGFARMAFEKSLKELKREKKFKELIAVINKKNIASVKFFKKLGFKLKEKSGNWLKYYLDI